jgi:hypothetical protein
LPWPPQPEDRKDRHKDVMDVESVDDTDIDTGITSGADPSQWDPVEITQGHVDTCLNDDPGKQSAAGTSAAVCRSTQPQR